MSLTDMVRLQCRKKRNWAIALAGILFLLSVQGIRQMADKISFYECFWKNCVRASEAFLCPWVEMENNVSVLGRCIDFVSPALDLAVEEWMEMEEEEQNDEIQEDMGNEKQGKEEDESGVQASENELRESVMIQVGREGEPEMLSDLLEEGDIETEIEENTVDREMDATKREEIIRERQKEISMEALRDYDTLVKNFYTIDPTTMAGSDQLNVDRLMERDMRLEQGMEGPQILIYHTHSQEAYADSAPGDPNTSVVRVGEELAGILREEYGYDVLHHTGEYDKPSRNEAYSRALPEVEGLLEEYPSIQVVIDLHRDEMPENTRLVTEVDGRKTARFMFFNGLSRTKRTGNLDYLYNPNLEDNLAFSFQLEKAAQEYYPGLTRKIYLKGYRYNMHLKPKCLLIELGAQNNTLEEALNACGPLAWILDHVLQGKKD